MDEFFQRTGRTIKRALVPKEIWRKSQLDAMDNGDYVELTSDLSAAILKQATSTPTQKLDVINFASVEWESRPQRPQQLAIQLAEAGHRIFYIGVSPYQGEIPLIKKARLNVYLIKLPWLNSIGPLNSTLSLDDVVSAGNSLSKIIRAFCIHTAIVKVDQPSWQKIAAQTCQEFGWKLVYDCLDRQALLNPPSELVKEDERILLGKSDLVLFASEDFQQRMGSGVERQILLQDAADIPSASPAEGEPTSLNSWQEKAGKLDLELSRLFPKISIVVVTFNKLEYTRMCLESVVKNTEYPNYEIILVDNASVDGSVEYLLEFSRTHPSVTFLQNKKNLGFATANNIGVNAAIGDYLVLLNNDTIVTPGWLHSLLFHLNKDPQAGMIGPVTNAIGNEAKIDISYKELTDINYFAARRGNKYRGIAFEIQVLALFCAMITRNLYQRLGGLDERYQVGMFEDDDLALKIRQAGLLLLCAEDVFIHHFHGISFNQFENQELQRIFHENRRRFEQKWGVVWQPHQNRPRHE